MNAPLRLHPTLSETLRQQAGAIYQTWKDGHKSTAYAMMGQIPTNRLSYIVFTMTVLAVHEGDQHAFSHFIEGMTT